MCNKKHHIRTDQVDTDDLLIRTGGDQFILADGLVTHQALIVRAVPQIYEATVVDLSRKYRSNWT